MPVYHDTSGAPVLQFGQGDLAIHVAREGGESINTEIAIYSAHGSPGAPSTPEELGGHACARIQFPVSPRTGEISIASFIERLAALDAERQTGGQGAWNYGIQFLVDGGEEIYRQGSATSLEEAWLRARTASLNHQDGDSLPMVWDAATGDAQKAPGDIAWHRPRTPALTTTPNPS